MHACAEFVDLGILNAVKPLLKPMTGPRQFTFGVISDIQVDSQRCSCCHSSQHVAFYAAQETAGSVPARMNRDPACCAMPIWTPQPPGLVLLMLSALMDCPVCAAC
jgi:hypothetical protein